MKKLKYQNVTVSGLPGAGSTTLGQGLAKKLGWQYFSGGDFMRLYAIEKGLFDAKNSVHHDATVYGEEFDREIDFSVRKMAKQEKNRVLDAWLSGFMAQGLEGVLKVLVYCSDDRVRVDRIVNRDKVTVKEAKQHIFEREGRNVQKWRQMYAQEWNDWLVRRRVVKPGEEIDFWNPKLYDLIIDTYSYSRKETLQLALEALVYDF